jgi:hypothetical protein
MRKIDDLENKAPPIILLFLLILLLATVQQAEANSCSSRSASNWVYISGQWVNANGLMCAGQVPESYTGYCHIKTSTNPSVAVNYVGWTNWQCDLMDGSTIVSSQQFGGEVNNNSSSKETQIYWSYAYWLATHVAISGQHDANHNGANPSPWRATNHANY